MSEGQSQPSSKGLKILFGIGLLAIVAFLGYRFWSAYQKAPSTDAPRPTIRPAVTIPQKGMAPESDLKASIIPSPQPSVVAKPRVENQSGDVPLPSPPPAIIDFDKNENDAALQARMEQRKKAYGVAKGIDMVVKPDETIKVGDVIVPMREIEEQIRLRRGEIIEADIPRQNGDMLTPPQGSRLAEQIRQHEQQLAALEKRRQMSEQSESDAQEHEIESELKELRQTLQMAETYRRVAADIQKKLDTGADTNGEQNAKAQVDALQARKNKLEKALQDRMNAADASETPTDEYGLYLVRPGDNIWNIHFRFLSGYFQKKGVALSPMADEPIGGGVSSGVGKLLKFSENRVYLYNLENRQLDLNLNQLTPYKKIVIYNMRRVFDLLDRIDYQQVDRIHFDGEAIWIVRD